MTAFGFDASSDHATLHVARIDGPDAAANDVLDQVQRVWLRIDPVLRDLKLLVASIDRAALRTGIVPAPAREQLELAFAGIEGLLRGLLDEDGDSSAEVRAELGTRVQAELLPLMLLSENGERWYSKPRGYAGDYLSIARMYDDEPRGHGRVGSAVDRCFLNLAAVRAVQNRRALVADEIRAALDRCRGRSTRVTSLACGPARELFDVYHSLPDPTVLVGTLVDVDLHALAYVADLRDRAGLRRQLTLVADNLVHLANGRSKASFTEQDLVYSIGLIDYFEDTFVVKLIDFIHGTLRRGGRVLLGNFHPRNDTRAVMDHVLDWKLIHRTEEDMHRLFRASAFGRDCTRIVYEPQRINLFAECIKA
jgi:extracellular factor (EF) 3-hydroxypalmitic acid methyl ester biosynthesis protein